MAEAILTGIQAPEIAVRSSNTDKLVDYITKKKGINSLQSEQKLRLIRNVLANIKDANHRIVIGSLTCLDLLLSFYADGMVPHLNIAFDHCLIKLGDAKITVRTKAYETMCNVLMHFGFIAGVEKLYPHFSHKNVIVKERISHLIQELANKQLLLYEGNEDIGTFIVDMNSLLKNILILLQDSTGTVRTAASELLIFLHKCASIMSENSSFNRKSLLRTLEKAGIKSQILRSITDAMDANECNPLLNTRSGSGISNKNVSTNLLSTYNGIGTSSNNSNKSHGKTTVNDFRNLLNANTNPSPSPNSGSMVDGLASRNTKASSGSSNTIESISDGYLLSTKDPLSVIVALPPPLPCRPLDDDAQYLYDRALAALSGDTSYFHPLNYLNLLTEGTVVKPLHVFTEKEILNLFNNIEVGINNSDDWLARLNALSSIQGLMLGDGLEYVSVVSNCLRNPVVHSGISGTLMDLRSQLSKEGCRTVGLLAKTMGAHFAPLAELFIPTLLKQVGTATSQIMTGAATRAMFCIIGCNEVGFPRCIPLLLEGYASKVPALRLQSLNFLTLCASLWSTDGFDKYQSQLKLTIEGGLVDKNPDARKAARRLFWIVFDRNCDSTNSNVNWREYSQRILKNMDPQSRKMVISEIVTNNGNVICVSTELKELILKFAPINIPNALNTVNNAGISIANNVISRNTKTENELKSTVNSKKPNHALLAANSGLIHGKAEKEQVDKRNSCNSSATVPLKRATRGTRDFSSNISEENDVDDLVPDKKERTAAIQRQQPKPSQSEPEMVGKSASIASGAIRLFNSTNSSTESIGTKRMSVNEYMKTVDRIERSDRAEKPSEKTVESKSSGDTVGTKQRKDIMKVPHSSGTAPVLGLSSGAVRMNFNSNKTVDSISNSKSISVGTRKVGDTKTIKSESVKHLENVRVHGSDSHSNSTTTIDNPIPSTKSIKNAQSDISLEDLKSMIADGLWSRRVDAMESVHASIKTYIENCNENGLSVVEAQIVWSLIDIVLVGLTDDHHKVTNEALLVLALYIEHYKELFVCDPENPHTYHSDSVRFLGSCLPELFQKLLDQRPHIRQLANSLLNGIRVAYAPVSILAALSPRIVEVPDKVKTAVMQFLSVIVPHCFEYFSHPQQTFGFLSRISTILSNKPSHTLQQATTKLLELVYNVDPSIICNQIAVMPLQQQLVIKKTILSHVPDIDNLVVLAGRATHKAKKTASVSMPMNEGADESCNDDSSTGMGTGHSTAIGIVQPSLYDDEDDMESSGQDMEASEMNSSGSTTGLMKHTHAINSVKYVDGVKISPIHSQASSHGYSSPENREKVNTLSSDSYMSMESSSSASSMHRTSDSVGEMFMDRSTGTGNVINSKSVDSIQNIYADGLPDRSKLDISSSHSYYSNTSRDAANAGSRSRDVLSPKPSMIASVSPSVTVNKGSFSLIPEMRPVAASTPSSTGTGAYSNANITGNPSPKEMPNSETTSETLTNRDISWFIESLQQSSDTPTKLVAVKEIKSLAKQPLREFWINNCGQLLSVLLEPFSPEFFKNATTNSSSSPYAPVTGFTPNATAVENSDGIKLNKEQQRHMESMHISCKAISILIKYRGVNVKNFMELLVTRLTQVVAFTPATISYQCEQLLTEALNLDPHRFITIVLPYTASGEHERGFNDHVRLLALHVLASAIRLLPSAIFLSNGTKGDAFTVDILKHILPSFNSPLVDMRKGVVFILVEIYGVIGDALYPYIIHDMTPPQKKLLAIYIQRYKSSKK